MENSEQSILTFYGVEDTTGIGCETFEFDYSENLNKAVSCLKLLRSSLDVMVLMVAINVDGTYERKVPLPKVIHNKFGIKLCCEVIVDSLSQARVVCVRVGALRVADNQISEIAEALYRLSACSFLVCAKQGDEIELSQKLVHVMCDEGRTLEKLTTCCNTTLAFNASFIHVLKGFDGYSINRLFPRKSLQS